MNKQEITKGLKLMGVCSDTQQGRQVWEGATISDKLWVIFMLDKSPTRWALLADFLEPIRLLMADNRSSNVIDLLRRAAQGEKINWGVTAYAAAEAMAEAVNGMAYRAAYVAGKAADSAEEAALATDDDADYAAAYAAAEAMAEAADRLVYTAQHEMILTRYPYETMVVLGQAWLDEHKTKVEKGSVQ